MIFYRFAIENRLHLIPLPEISNRHLQLLNPLYVECPFLKIPLFTGLFKKALLKYSEFNNWRSRLSEQTWQHSTMVNPVF